MRNNSLPIRTATTWNMQPSEVAMADTTKVFKSKIDEHMISLSVLIGIEILFGVTIIRLQADKM